MKDSIWNILSIRLAASKSFFAVEYNDLEKHNLENVHNYKALKHIANSTCNKYAR